MKKAIKLIAAASIISCLISCSKSTDNAPGPQPAGVIYVTNAVIGGATLTLTSNSLNIISGGNTVGINAATWFPLAGGQNTITLGVPAIAATPTTPAIPAIVYYTGTFNIDNSSNYSIFLTGASSAAIDTVVINENAKSQLSTYTDSICGVRFINLAPGSNPVSVNIKGNANGSEAGGIAYKGYTDFITYPAKKANSAYIFEFRDAGTGTLIASYTLATPYFNHVALALRGTVGGNVGVILLKYY